MMRNTLIVFFIFSSLTLSFSQTGGRHAYEFLNLPFSARTASLGGNTISTKDDDINLSLQNPSLLDSSMSNKLAFNYINYFTDVNYGYSAYARHFKNIGTFSTGVQFLNYGKFTAADETGQITGQFEAADYSLNLAYARALDSSFAIGGTLKTIYSVLENYSSVGSAIDIAGTYHNKKKRFTAAAVIKNMGIQWKSYRPGNKESLPFEIQLGLSKKLAKAPFRFSIIGTHLEKWDLTYEDPANPTLTTDPLTQAEIKPNRAKIWGDKFARHIVLGSEFLLTKNFNIRFGYNYLRRQELKVDSRTGLVGFSFGLGFKISKFNLSYGRASYHLAGASNHFSITTNLSDFYSKK